MTVRWRIVIEYKGTDYYGWQIQKDVPTIQERIQNAVFQFSQQKVQVTASGRTDAGVHARAQIAHFDLDDGKDWQPDTVVNAINAHLPDEPISILHAEICDDDFHARFSASRKTYHYMIAARVPYLTIDEGLFWHVKRNLDVDAMHDAAQILVGHHDFTSFRDSECQSASPVKTLDHIAVNSVPYDDFGGQHITIEVRAKSFLHHQVRNFAGSLKLVGEGKWSRDDLQNALDAKDRKLGGPTAPACGLYMHRVYYD